MTEEQKAAIHKELAEVYEGIARRRTVLIDSTKRYEELQVRTSETNRRMLAHAAELERRLAEDVTQPSR